MRYNLSEVTAIIRDRRTIYPEQFSNRKIHQEQVELLLNNAIWAPTHGKTQPWRFIVFQENERITLGENLASAYLENVSKEEQNDAKVAKLLNRPQQSSVVIALILERKDSAKISYEDDFAALACAVQNMHLTATTQGIGAFWSTPKIMNSEKIRNFLTLSETQSCVGFFYLGYPAIDWPKGQRKPIEYLTEWRK